MYPRLEAVIIASQGSNFEGDREGLSSVVSKSYIHDIDGCMYMDIS
jgi:hypothetical protein